MNFYALLFISVLCMFSGVTYFPVAHLFPLSDLDLWVKDGVSIRVNEWQRGCLVILQVDLLLAPGGEPGDLVVANPQANIEHIRS